MHGSPVGGAIGFTTFEGTSIFTLGRGFLVSFRFFFRRFLANKQLSQCQCHLLVSFYCNSLENSSELFTPSTPSLAFALRRSFSCTSQQKPLWGPARGQKKKRPAKNDQQKTAKDPRPSEASGSGLQAFKSRRNPSAFN